MKKFAYLDTGKDIISDKTILIVEDDANSSELLVQALRKTNLKLIKVTNGQLAIDAVDENPEISIILMDIKMPVMDGLSAAEIIKKKRPDIIIIVQTALIYFSDRQKAKEVGCDDFITKPIIIKEFLDVIRKYL